MAKVINSIEEFRAYIESLTPEEKEKLDKTLMDTIDRVVWQDLTKKVEPPSISPLYTYTSDWPYRDNIYKPLYGYGPFPPLCFIVK